MDKFGCTLQGNTFVTPIDLSIYAPSKMSSQLFQALGNYWSLWRLSVPKASSQETKPASTMSKHEANMLVISTAVGISDWISQLDNAYVDNSSSAMKWVIYDPLMSVENITKYKIVFVRIPDVARLLAQTGISTWSHVTLDKTAIGEEQLMATMPSLRTMLNLTKAILI
ncbi:hypothetical protein IWW36_003320 [Coemansia brasiliensis]|uniref:Uncharacterized protein n=1 Tax=Coemansia brasiliensis TaxID=2650707 RepID=A0A9W8ID10_9FUNG|nr:hypothetical protein IWW36_003320 [Coemansia brasiliensis]